MYIGKPAYRQVGHTPQINIWFLARSFGIDTLRIIIIIISSLRKKCDEHDSLKVININISHPKIT